MRIYFYILLFLVISFSHAEPPGSLSDIQKRLELEWGVCVEGNDCGSDAQASNSVRSGLEIYNTYCAACHSSGVGGAPIYGKKTDWTALAKRGRTSLLSSIKKGVPPLMPPKGSCADCTDSELSSVLDYFLEAL